MNGDALVRVRVTSVGDRPQAAWAEGLEVHVPASLVSGEWRDGLVSDGTWRIPAGTSPVADAHVTQVRERHAFTETPPASARLPFSYQRVPGRMRALVGSAIGRWNRRSVDRWGAFPRWPIDLSADFLNDLIDGTERRSSMTMRPPAAVIVSHDIDSPEGLTNLVSAFLPLEEAVGARSTNFVVPCGWELDGALLSEILARGHGLGVHGYDHSNRTPFVDTDARVRRLDAARAFGERHHATGYRAPSLLRTRALFRDLAPRFRYDSSIPTSGGLFPSPNNGCATARPFSVEQMLELPISLPRDGMLRFLGYSAREIVRMWQDCADLIARAGGVVVLLTHCEQRFSGEPRMLDAYRAFLEHMAAHRDRFVFSTPERVLFGSA